MVKMFVERMWEGIDGRLEMKMGGGGVKFR
jgi:hypothetical protein